MNSDELVTVATRASEVEAEVLVNVLRDAGIKAVALGGFTAGFRAEAPGWVQVQTFSRDADQAREVIESLVRLPADQWADDSDQSPDV